MPENRSRFVLLCQQSLAFGLVAAIAAPAANVMTLDIIAPTQPSQAGPPAIGAQGATDGGTPSLVATDPVKPRVTTVPLAGVSERGTTGGGTGQARLASFDGDPETDHLTVLSAPQPVDGLATVGVTWADAAELSDHAITVSVRTQTDGVWAQWQDVPFHEEEGPDPASVEGQQARPGTDPIYVGDVDDVQVKAVTDSGEAPEGMRLSMVDPGTETAPEVEEPDIDTGDLELSATDTGETTDETTDESTDETTDETTDDASLSAGGVTAKPLIYSRSQWGADERMRDKSSLHYSEVHAGFVHHTVNANGYTRAQVPSIIRGIYAYHTQSRGWSDVGYNFLVDRFGRIWEGRYGGVDRPVVGAHTLGYNDDAFAMSAIGNFDVTQPSSAVVDAYGRLFAWKLSLHGVPAGSMKRWVTKRYLPAINGHRDVGQTACPGRYLYAKIPTIRNLAAQYQKPFTSRNRRTNLSGGSSPELVVRDKVTDRVSLIRLRGGQLGFSAGTTAATGWGGMDLITAVRDITGDGVADLLGRDKATRRTGVYPGTGKGQFGAAVRTTSRFRYLDQLTGVGDWNRDGNNDVVGRNAATKRLYVYFGDANGGLGATYRLLSTNWGAYSTTVGAGDFTGDRKADLLARNADGRLMVVPGTDTGIGTPRLVSSGWAGVDLVTGLNDFTNDGRMDVVGRHQSTGAVYIYKGDGTGSYRSWLGPFRSVGDVSRLVGSGQFAGSRAVDLLGRDSSGRLQVFTSNGGLAAGQAISTGRTAGGANLFLNVGDWNSDGRGDLVTRSGSTGNLFLYPGTGGGALGAPVRIATGFGSVRLLAAVGDMTGDGFPDLLGQPSGGAMRIYPGNGRTGFRSSYVAHSAISANRQFGVGRWNSDGSPDSLLRRSDGALVLYPGNGPGGLTGGTRIASAGTGYDWMVAAGDVNADGRPDLVAREAATGKLWLRPGTSSGFGTRRLVTTGMGRYDLAG